jgi:PHD/YefM family antitoxin component YafN of YafNO toxin-antitoxin module
MFINFIKFTIFYNMYKTITATELTHNTKTVITTITADRKPVIVLNYREPVAVIMDYSSWQALTQKKAPSIDNLRKFMESTGSKTDLTKTIRKMRDAE